jgi:hypothetical protein
MSEPIALNVIQRHINKRVCFKGYLVTEINSSKSKAVITLCRTIVLGIITGF